MLAIFKKQCLPADLIMFQDSTEITDEDREEIAELCSKVPADKVIITHGTDTMIETANYLARDDRLLSKTVVLTGAMRYALVRACSAA